MPEIPQTPRAGFRFQTVQNLDLARRMLPTVADLYLGQIFGIERPDLVPDHCADCVPNWGDTI